jgi:hypothetical protein
MRCTVGSDEAVTADVGLGVSVGEDVGGVIAVWVGVGIGDGVARTIAVDVTSGPGVAGFAVNVGTGVILVSQAAHRAITRNVTMMRRVGGLLSHWVIVIGVSYPPDSG